MAIQQRNLKQLQTFTILSPVVVATNNDTTGVDLSGIDGDALFILNAATSGTANKTIDVKLEHSATVDGTYAAVPGGAFTVLGNAAVQQKISVPREELNGFYRLSFTGIANSYSAAVSCVAVGAARYAI
jgi:hypothetical protein